MEGILPWGGGIQEAEGIVLRELIELGEESADELGIGLVCLAFQDGRSQPGDGGSVEEDLEGDLDREVLPQPVQ
jgi:hypothetical protein